MSKDKDDYEVGYGKPPKATQFKKGQRGNPNGRPKKVSKDPASISDTAMEVMTSLIALADGRKMTGLEALVHSLRTNALGKGNTQAAKLLLDALSGGGRGSRISKLELERLVRERVAELEEQRHAETAAGAERFKSEMVRLHSRLREGGWRFVRFERDGTLSADTDQQLSLAQKASLLLHGAFDKPAK